MEDVARIAEVVKSKICTGCGACYSACPKGAISISEDKKYGIYLAHINEVLCIHCGRCAEVCPQIEVLEGKEDYFENFLGEVKYTFYGYASEEKIRYNASSGGLITAISCYALKEKIVDGIIAVKATAENPLRFEAAILTEENDVKDASGSKYCPISLNKILRVLADKKNGNRCIYIGLACHLKGLKKYLELFPSMREKIIYIFGIFCSHAPNFHGTDYLVRRNGISAKDIRSIKYRGEGWPGNIIIETDRTVRMSAQTVWSKYFGNHYFSSKYCLVCDDLFARDCDISFGDAWLKQFESDAKGISIGIARTKKGKKLLEECTKKGEIFNNAIKEEAIFDSQRENVLFKRDMLYFRKKLYSIPAKSTKEICLSMKLYNIYMLFNSYLSRIFLFVRFLITLPGILESLYFSLVTKIRYIVLKKIK